MSTLIPLIGRKSLKARLAYFIMYALLILGGITMVVPFLALLSNSFKSSVDSLTFEIPPRFFYDQKWLGLKYVEQEVNYDMELYKGLQRVSTATMKDVALPAPASIKQQEDYYEFLRSLPITFTYLTCRGKADANPGNTGTHPAVLDYRKAILAKYGSLAAVERKHGVPLPDREQLTPPFEKWHLRTYQPDFDLRMQDFIEFKLTQLQKYPERIIPAAAEAKWNVKLRSKYVADVKKVKEDLGVSYPSIEAAMLPLRRPSGSKAYIDMWDELMRVDMPIWFVRADDGARPAWTKFLKERFLSNIAEYNKAHPGATYARFEDIPLPARESKEYTLLKQGYTVSEWSDFIGNKISGPPAASLYLDTPEQRYRDFLKEKFGTVEAMKAAYGISDDKLTGWGQVYLPTIPVKVLECQQHASAIRAEFIIRNYRTVANYLLLHGRAFLNTAVFILLALFFTLTVNPITAYALSRFKLKSANKILLFLLATMAFPAEIAMIPNFLILKELHLLNSYWALVLPGMASGFSIFLLKGMFDGLPQDLYEAAMLDGAGEAIIFWKITMPLVAPYLAYLSLGTFVACYSAYIFALLLCPDPKMWTIMVFLQQMDWAGQPVKFAAYVLASIPTLIVFVTCQRIIMRGIVLPTEK